ncbi:helix-turn-helix domain-containing protein [Arthrobacter halodurans]|uniref:Helix-turn-helix domain-containing protein n=1 Tax=Arthrobacter halodurans TaxID=516699 RepID=A0ABV4UPT2_9MICC
MQSATNPFRASNPSTQSMLASSMVHNFESVLDALCERRSVLPLEAFAEKLDVSPEEVLAIESREESPTLDFLITYAMALNVHIELAVENGAAWAKQRREQAIAAQAAEVWHTTARAPESRSWTQLRQTFQRANA